MHSMDVSASRATRSRTYHVLPVRLLVCSCFLFTCLFTLLLWTVDSSVLTILSYAYPFRLVCRLVIPGPLTRYDSFSPYVYLYLYLAVIYIYGWGWGLIPHLQSTLQPPYKCDLWDPTYSPSSLIARWPRLLLCDLLKGVYSPFSVYRLLVVKSSLCVYFGALVTLSKYMGHTTTPRMTPSTWRWQLMMAVRQHAHSICHVETTPTAASPRQ